MTTDRGGGGRSGDSFHEARLAYLMRLPEEVESTARAMESLWRAQLEAQRLLATERFQEDLERTRAGLREIDRIMEDPRLRLEAVGRLADEPLRRMREFEAAVGQTLDRLPFEDMLRTEAHLADLIERVQASQSAMETAVSMARTLRPPQVELEHWKLAWEAVDHRIEQIESGAEEFEERVEALEPTEERLVKQIFLIIWAIFGNLAHLSFAIQFVTGGEHSLVPQWPGTDAAPSPAEQLVEVMETGPTHIVRCRAVMRVGPDASEEAVYRLDEGDTVRIYEGEARWVKALCTETWHAGWVYRRHLKSP